MSITVASPQTNPNGGRFHWTVDTFYRAIEADIFDERKRLELVHGELWEKEILHPPHASGLRRTGRVLRQLLAVYFLINEEKPLHIDADNEPIPDFYLVAGQEDDYESRHPRADEVRLLIEVADTTADRDTGAKALLYAQAGIADYWVMLINARELWVFRDPMPTGYAPPLRLAEADTISPLAAPSFVIPVGNLLPRGRSAADETG